MTSSSPVRTCVGCRRSAPASELLRVVVAPDATVEHDGPRAAGPAVVPDPRRRAAGRGAHVHPDLRCVADAVRRRAFARALRVPGPVDPVAVTEFVSGPGTHEHDRTTSQIQ